MKFEDLNLAPAILDAVRESGYTEPTPVQREAIPIVLEGRDLLAGAQTGTGKTAGFTLPILQHLDSTPAKHQGAIRALVLAPTRELAAQVHESIQTYGKNLKLKSTVIFGGVGMNPQIKRIAAGCDILVATPGRLLDLQGQGHIDLSHIEILVLDEADRMLDMGFIHDVKKVLALVPKTRQTLLFSATFSDEIRALAAKFLNDPKSVQVTPPNTTVELIRQVIYPVGRKRKMEALTHLIGDGDWRQVLVFTRTKFGANRLADHLNENGIKAMALHGNKSQGARTQALADFKTGELRALVATDIAARGIDIDDLPHVVNYDIPNVPEDYVHRIGRTGRAGATGEAASLVCMDEEGFMHTIERFTKQQIPVQILSDFGPEDGEHAEPIAMGRQTLWGGLGPTPSRDVMQAAARAARQEMMQRIRASKGDKNRRRSNKPAQDGNVDSRSTNLNDEAAKGSRAPQERRHRRRGRGGNDGVRADSTGSHDRRRGQPQEHDHGPMHESAPREDGHADRLPRNIDPLQTNLHTRRRSSSGNTGGHDHPGGQPDPLRTSVDVMGSGNRNKRGRPGGSSGARNRYSR